MRYGTRMKPEWARKVHMLMSGHRSVHARSWCGTIAMIPCIFLGSSPRTWFGAICPARGVGAAIVMPEVNTEAMNEHLKEISTRVARGAHAVLVLDGAGWHQTGGRLHVPDNITLLSLPPYAPELNPMENVWEYLRGNKLCALVWDTYDAIVEACCKAWRFLTDDPGRVRSIGSREWASVSG